jgi:hypothetical protein
MRWRCALRPGRGAKGDERRWKWREERGEEGENVAIIGIIIGKCY